MVGGWSAPCPGRFNPGKDPVSIVQEAGCAPGPVWTGGENLAPTPGFDPRTVQPVASSYTELSRPPVTSKAFRKDPNRFESRNCTADAATLSTQNVGDLERPIVVTKEQNIEHLRGGGGGWGNSTKMSIHASWEF